MIADVFSIHVNILERIDWLLIGYYITSSEQYFSYIQEEDKFNNI